MNAQPFAPGALTASDLTGEAQALFRRVLRSMPATLDQHATALGWTTTAAAQRLSELESLRLVQTTTEGMLRADDPRATLGRLLDSEEADLDHRRQQVLELRRSIENYETDYRRGLQLSGPRVPPWEQVTPSEAPAVLAHLARTSRGPVLQVVGGVDIGTGHPDDLSRHREEPVAAGREHRTIFPLAVLTDPRWHAFAADRASAGETQRYREDIPVQFAVYGRSGVLLDEGGREDSDFLLIRPLALIDVFVALFDELWRRSVPVHQDDTAQQDRKVLELLALGFKDEAIARHLGLGLRTVRRRISALMVEHRADTRFQLGLAVSRRGLLAGPG